MSLSPAFTAWIENGGLSTAALLFLSAADMPVKAVPLPPVFSWTGFYIPGNAGSSWGRASTDLTETVSTTATITTLNGTPIASATATTTSAGSDRAHLNGGLAGAQAGYNWQTNRYVWGLEGDIQWTGERGGGPIWPVPPGGAAGPGPGPARTQFGPAEQPHPRL